ncbi:MAG: S9 family peptidase [Alphaproteobacteria bacterium]|nr:S9 family peptidase [Alphaproteobacteria bacterium]MBV9372336.1 S9 family peptidase [Alphaproteobacteria bacterium]MBV9899628.1 S9 family peptidase [Alphaproteobacteria bacterium]
MLIPRRLLFSSSLGSSAQLSPAGDLLAFPRRGASGSQGIWVKPLKGGEMRQVASSHDVQTVVWAADGRHVLYLEDADGDEQYRCVAVDLEGRVRPLTPRGLQARILGVSAARPDDVMVLLNEEDRRRHDVYRLNLPSGRYERVAVNPGNVVGWVADSALAVRAALATTSSGGFQLLVREDEDSGWNRARSWGPEEHGHPLFFSAAGDTLYLIANHDAETNRLIALDMKSGRETVLAEDRDYDIVSAVQDPVTGVPQAAVVSAERSRTITLDPAIGEDLAAIRDAMGESFRVFNRSGDGRVWLLSSISDRHPPACYVYESESRRVSLAIDDYSEFDRYALSRMEPIAFRARDGLLLRGYLTLPPGQGKAPGPAVLKVHGGPWARDTWGFDPMVQWLANRGYAVLQLNYRGSAGYGKGFLAAGHRQWGRRMQDDLIDGIAWLVARGVADPARIGIMGASYGGYAALAGLSLTPEAFAAGVCMFGPSDLMAFLRNVPKQWTSYRSLLHARVGDPEVDAEALEGVSPIKNYRSIRAPLLVAHGANDARVPCAETDRFVSALRSAGGTVDYLVFADEGHGFTRPENRLHLCARIEAFLASHLRGECEPEEEGAVHAGTER